MRVLDPGSGECLDRLSILEMKIRAAGLKQAWEVKHEFEVEKVQVEEYLKDKYPEFSLNTTMYIKYHRTLSAVNSQLWVCIDKARQGDMLSRLYVENGLFMVRLIDRRAEIIAEINKMSGIERKEKL